MPKLPMLSGKKLLRLLIRNGFILRRQKSSHITVVHRDDESRRTVVPLHGNRELTIGTWRKILRDLKLAPKDIHDWMS